MNPLVKITGPEGYMATDCFSEEFSRRIIYITEDITSKLSSEVCSQINQLVAMSDEDITLWIQSPGGSVTAGFAILDTMEACGCDICTIVMGSAASMAAVLASSGTKGKRYVGRNAEMMIHQALGGVSGQTADILRTASRIQKTNERLYGILAANTGRSVEQIAADCDRDYFLDSAECIEYGLADKVYGD